MWPFLLSSSEKCLQEKSRRCRAVWKKSKQFTSFKCTEALSIDLFQGRLKDRLRFMRQLKGSFIESEEARQEVGVLPGQSRSCARPVHTAASTGRPEGSGRGFQAGRFCFVQVPPTAESAAVKSLRVCREARCSESL